MIILPAELQRKEEEFNIRWLKEYLSFQWLSRQTRENEKDKDQIPRQQSEQKETEFGFVSIIK